jgi:hypothetical protein
VNGKPKSRCRAGHCLIALSSAALLTACVGGPASPEWQLQAHSALDRSVTAYLGGDSRVAAQEFDLARTQLARTGRIDLMARAELLRCAAQIASLDFKACDGFEAIRIDAAAAERAYADFLTAEDAALLAPSQRVLAAIGLAGNPAQALRDLGDPLSRLVAAGVLLRAGRANPEVIALAVDTASSQGWRRPLLAWLNLQLQRAERAGATAELERLRRRIDWTLKPP